MTTNQVILIALAVWSILFWICGWIANIKRKKRNDLRNRTSL